jgi:glutaminyl-tRNA synthetase
VAANTALDCDVRLYDRLFRIPDPDAVEEGKDFLSALNPHSLVVRTAKIEPSVADAPPGTRYQFERTGYFMSDPVDSRAGSLVFNKTVGLRDSWAREAKRQAATD